MIEHHDHWWSFDWLMNYWPLVLGGLATVSGAFWLALHKRFPTHSEMMKCKLDLDLSLKEHEIWEAGMHKTSAEDNRVEHNEIKAEMRDVRKEIGHVRGDVGELKNLLIRLGSDK